MWVYEQDPEALAEAQKELDDFHTEQKIENIEDLIEAEEDEIEILEENLKKEKEAYDERIKAIEKYKDKWNKVKTEHEKAQNEIVAKAILGADAEKEILMGIDGEGGRLDVLNDFKEKYSEALQGVASEAESAALRANTATSSLLSNYIKILQQENISGIVDDDTYKPEYDLEEVVGSVSGETYYRDFSGDYFLGSDVEYIGDEYGFKEYFIKKGTPIYNSAYASGTKSATSGLANVDEKGNELIIPKQGRYRMMEYGDTVVPHNLSQRIFEVASNPLRFISNALNSVKTPNLMSNSNTNSSYSTIHIGTIELPSVTNGESFIKQLQLIAANR